MDPCRPCVYAALHTSLSCAMALLSCFAWHGSIVGQSRDCHVPCWSMPCSLYFGSSSRCTVHGGKGGMHEG